MREAIWAGAWGKVGARSLPPAIGLRLVNAIASADVHLMLVKVVDH